MDGKLISQLKEQLDAVKGNELLLVEDKGTSKKMPISLLATAGAGGVNVGDIVLPDKTTMSFESYKASGRSDAIGVVFDKFKGLFVRNTIIEGALATSEKVTSNNTSAVRIFYDTEVRSFNFTNGKEILLECKALSTLNFSLGFPAFNKAMQINQDCYIPSIEELRLILSRVSEELKFLGLSWRDDSITSCSWDGARYTSRINVFYGGNLEWKHNVENVENQFFVIDSL